VTEEFCNQWFIVMCGLGVVCVLGCFGRRIGSWVKIQFIVRMKRLTKACGVRQGQGQVIAWAVFRRLKDGWVHRVNGLLFTGTAMWVSCQESGRKWDVG